MAEFIFITDYLPIISAILDASLWLPYADGDVIIQFLSFRKQHIMMKSVTLTFTTIGCRERDGIYCYQLLKKFITIKILKILLCIRFLSSFVTTIKTTSKNLYSDSMHRFTFTHQLPANTMCKRI